MISIATKELSPTEIEAVNRIKDWVNQSIYTRDQIAEQSPAVKPKPVWQLITQIFAYLKVLPPEQFKNLLVHTYPFNGLSHLNCLSTGLKEFQLRYNFLHTNLPPRYRISAPEACGECGYMIDGRLVTEDVIRWQELIRVLWKIGELARLERLNRPVILDIGGGYGDLAHYFHCLFPQALYIIVDIPETLLFSASYLTLIHGKEKVILLDSEKEVSPESLKGESFLMVPNHLMPVLIPIPF